MKLAKAVRPIGRLSNGKEFYGDANHPAHGNFTAQEHAEAVQNLVHRTRRMMSGNHMQNDQFAIQHAKRLSGFARSHGQMAKRKGLPKAA